MEKIFDFQFMIDVIPEILQGIPYTVLIAIVSYIIGIFIGFIGAICKIFKVPVLERITTVAVSFFRGTPLIVQILLFYYGIPIVIRLVNQRFGTAIDIMWIPTIVFMSLAFSFNAGAYLSESIRSAIQAIDKTQMEAAYSVGMTTKQAMRRIILPQAIKIGIPVFANYFISLLKETSLAFTAAVPEIMGQAKIVAGRASRFFEAYIDAAIIYWIICIILERVVVLIEKRAANDEKEVRK